MNIARWNGELLALCGDRDYPWIVLSTSAYDAVRWLRYILGQQHQYAPEVLAQYGDDLAARFAALASYARVSGQLDR